MRYFLTTSYNMLYSIDKKQTAGKCPTTKRARPMTLKSTYKPLMPGNTGVGGIVLPFAESVRP